MLESERAIEEKIAQFKKTGKSFVQDAPCFEKAPQLDECRGCLSRNHCRKNKQQTNATNESRFYHFRLLRYDKNGELCIAGFLRVKDASVDDLELWLPQPEEAVKDLGVEMAICLLTHVGYQFYGMVQIEKTAKADALVAGATNSGSVVQEEGIAWKRVIKGVREMCDECETTLFNFHRTCEICGYAVCINCYNTRCTPEPPSNNGPGDKSKDDKKEEKDKDQNLFGWLFCTSLSCHDPSKLVPTQITAGKPHECLGHLVHTYRKELNTAQFCDCPEDIQASRTTTESNGGAVSSVSDGTVKGLGGSESKWDCQHSTAKRQKVDSCVIERVVDRKASPHHHPSASGNNLLTLATASPSNTSAAHALAPTLKTSTENGGTKKRYLHASWASL